MIVTNVGNMLVTGSFVYCAYASDVEGILKFKSFKGFGKQVACETANN
jgi:hypothetical protein